MHAGEQLRLGGSGVAAEQDVDVPAEVRAALVVGLIAPEEHAEQAFLDVVHAPTSHRTLRVRPDRRGDGRGQLRVDVFVVRQLHQPRFFAPPLLLHLLHVVQLLALHGEALIDLLAVVQHVDKRVEHVPHRRPIRRNPHGQRSENPGHLHFVAGLHAVEELFRGEHRDGLRRLALRDLVGNFLHLDDLLVVENAVRGVDPQGVGAVALLATRGAVDAVADAVHLGAMFAVGTDERGDANVGNQVAHARDHALHTDQLVDVVGGEVSHRMLVSDVEYVDVDGEWSGWMKGAH